MRSQGSEIPPDHPRALYFEITETTSLVRLPRFLVVYLAVSAMMCGF